LFDLIETLSLSDSKSNQHKPKNKMVVIFSFTVPMHLGSYFDQKKFQKHIPLALAGILYEIHNLEIKI
jgi:hypothetical protein